MSLQLQALEDVLPPVLAEIADAYAEMTTMDLYEEMKDELDPGLSDVVEEYMSIRDLATLMASAPGIPSRKLWRRRLKNQHPILYTQLKHKLLRTLRSYDPDTQTLLIMAGLYRYDNALDYIPIIGDDFNMRLFLDLFLGFHAEISPQAVYDQLSDHLRYKGMGKSILFLMDMGATLDVPTAALFTMVDALDLDTLRLTLTLMRSSVDRRQFVNMGAYFPKELLRDFRALINPPGSNSRSIQTVRQIERLVKFKEGMVEYMSG